MKRWCGLGAVVLGVVLSVAAQAGTISGTVAQSGTALSPQAGGYYWRLPAKGVAVRRQSATSSAVVVSLEGREGGVPAAQPQPLIIAGMAFDPPVLPILVGSTIRVENRSGYSLRLAVPQLLKDRSRPPVQRVASGGAAEAAYGQVGQFSIDAVDWPEMGATILVLPSPYFALVRGGVFRMEDVPAGTYRLKVWRQGRWIHQGSVEVPAVGEVTVDVYLN